MFLSAFLVEWSVKFPIYFNLQNNLPVSMLFFARVDRSIRNMDLSKSAYALCRNGRYGFRRFSIVC